MRVVGPENAAKAPGTTAPKMRAKVSLRHAAQTSLPGGDYTHRPANLSSYATLKSTVSSHRSAT